MQLNIQQGVKATRVLHHKFSTKMYLLRQSYRSGLASKIIEILGIVSKIFIKYLLNVQI